MSVEPFHLFRYLDEQSFRFNNRKASDAERFNLAVSGILNKRVMFTQLTGKQYTAEHLLRVLAEKDSNAERGN